MATPTLETVPELRYEDMTGEELAQQVAELSGMTVSEVMTDGVQTSLVALHLSGGVPEDREDLIRLATGETFVRPTAFTRVHPAPNAAGGVMIVDVPMEDINLTGPQQIDAAIGIRPVTANANVVNDPAAAKATPAAKAAPVPNDGRPPNAPPVDHLGLNDIPVETTHLMCERVQMHRLSRNGPVNREVCAALTLMDCGKDVKTVWSDLDMYVVNDSTDEMGKIEQEAMRVALRLYEAQMALAEAVYKREWSEECPIISVLLPGTRSGGMSGCRFDHPDEHSNGPMSSLRLEVENELPRHPHCHQWHQ